MELIAQEISKLLENTLSLRGVGCLNRSGRVVGLLLSFMLQILRLHLLSKKI